MEIKQLDLNFDDKIKKLIEYVNKKLPDNRNWLVEIILWNDGDYRIELASSWGKYKDVFYYQKSVNKYKYRKVIVPGITGVELEI